MNILFVTYTRIGDAVLSTGLLDSLHTRYPHARFTIACGPDAAPVFEHFPGLHRLIIVKKRKASLHWLSLWAQTSNTYWDMVIDLRRSALAWLLPARKRFVFKGTTEDSPKVAQLAALMNISPPPAPRLWVGEDERQIARTLLPAGVPYIALAPAANWIGKEWPPERYAELAAIMHAAWPEAVFVLLATESQRAITATVARALPATHCLNFTGALSVMECAGLLERCTLFIGNDSGLMHLSAAAGIATVGLFGPTNDVLYGPYSPRARVVRTPEGWRELLAQPEPARYMENLRVADVMAAATASLSP